jgi:hypothetical protein
VTRIWVEDSASENSLRRFGATPRMERRGIRRASSSFCCCQCSFRVARPSRCIVVGRASGFELRISVVRWRVSEGHVGRHKAVEVIRYVHKATRGTGYRHVDGYNEVLGGVRGRPGESSRCIITIRRLAAQMKVWQATKESKRPPWTWHVSKPLTDAIERSAPGTAPDCMNHIASLPAS